MNRPRWWCVLSVFCLAWPALSAEPPELRGAWLWGASCTDAAKADQMLARAEAMNLNALFVLTFYWSGTATHRSELAPMYDKVATGFDPLGYLIEQGRRRGIEVHAWFVNGSCHGQPRGQWFKDHPQWAVRSNRGDPQPWFDLLQPVVRDYQMDLMVEVAKRYDVASVHFDYIRFNDKSVRSTPEVEAAAAKELGFAPGDLVSSTFPAVGAFSGNPLDQPTTAQVLARFDGGVPAVALNRLGQGQVFLLNYHTPGPTPAAAEALVRAIERLGVARGGTVLLLLSDLNAVRYGHHAYESARAWLGELGLKVKAVRDGDLAKLPARSVVILPGHYLMTEEQAAALVQHVRAGGGAVFLDGPVFAMKHASARELLGFKGTAAYFTGERTIRCEPVADNFLPNRPDAVLPTDLPVRLKAWDQWRKDQVTKLVAQVTRRVRAEAPGKLVTAAVFYNEAGSEGVLQDWPRWLREDLLDYAVPMSYVPTAAALKAAFAWWRRNDPGLARTVPAVGASSLGKGRNPAEQAAAIAEQIAVCRAEQAHGVVFFSLEGIPDETARTIGQTALTGKRAAWRPGR